MPAVSEKQRRAMYAAAEGRSILGIPKAVGEEYVRKDAASRGDCAGILFKVVRGPLYLLLKRADTGEWCIPGGHLEGDETPMEAAVRECEEEIGVCPEGLRLAARQNSIPGGKGLFTCFLQQIDEQFEPDLNEEHTDWGWFAPDALPQPMHRKVAETIERVTGNELHIAKRIAAGELLSPQRFETMWLFDIRITGTGTSYRQALNEYVYRPPEDFLTDEFVQRCNGLSVIFLHPKDSLLNTEEFRQRSIGSVVLPYIKGDEVRGVAKVFDDDAAIAMCTTHVSTSPAVVFRDAGSTETVKQEDGSTVLIEGNPSYLEHIAICEAGVWDKGGEPTGVNIEGVTAVEENEEKVPVWADNLGRRLDAMCARMDALENKGEVADRKDSEEVNEAEEKKDESKEEERKDFENAEEDGKKEREAEERADAQARENADLRAQIEVMNRRLTGITTPLSNEDREELSRVQMRADSLGQMYGESITPPLHGEKPIDYRKRLAAKFAKHSPTMKDVRLDSLDGAAFDLVEREIYADAQTAARAPANLPNGRLIPIVRKDSTGRQITEYEGDIAVPFAAFQSGGMTVRINRNHKGA